MPDQLYDQLSLAESSELHEQLLASSTLQGARHIASRILAEHPSLSVGLTLAQPHWRVRPADGPAGFRLLSQLLAPPEYKTRPGRANHENDPKLYLSARLETAIAEVHTPGWQHYHAVALMSRDEQQLRLAIVGEQHHVLRKDYLENFGYDPNGTIKTALRKQGPERAERIAFADALMADVIADPKASDKGYIPSRGLADALIHHAGNSHGIMYPSVRHHLGKNYCIDPAVAYRQLKVVACVVLRVDRVWPKGYFSLAPTAAYTLEDNSSDELQPVEAPGQGFVLFNLTDSEAQRLSVEP